MSTTTEVVQSPNSQAIQPWKFGDELTREQVELVKRTVCQGATDDEFRMFLHVCKVRRIDPFSKSLYLVPRYNSNTQREEKALQASIDYFRLIAERHGDEYQGQVGPQWCGKDEVWKDVWLSEEAPRAARVGVWRKGFREPLWGTALWSNYVQLTKDNRPTKFWRTMGPLMLGKCAESLALRRAFPEDLSGLYTGDEMQQAQRGNDEPLDAEIVEPAKTTKTQRPRSVADLKKNSESAPAASASTDSAPDGSVAPPASAQSPSTTGAAPANPPTSSASPAIPGASGEVAAKAAAAPATSSSSGKLSTDLISSDQAVALGAAKVNPASVVEWWYTQGAPPAKILAEYASKLGGKPGPIETWLYSKPWTGKRLSPFSPWTLIHGGFGGGRHQALQAALKAAGQMSFETMPQSALIAEACLAIMFARWKWQESLGVDPAVHGVQPSTDTIPEF